MLIALDYDETYTRDKILWDDFILTATQRGHTVICVTMRHEHEGQQVLDDLAHGLVETVIFTGRKAKYKFVTELGYYVSVWIDDSPHFIHMDAHG